ncbi:hypothetical protein K491DRAFT_501582 [Lophiostoma macrostomum CBS 122681]|uniref:Uncharacterized protein n=1 Tax=Lophiostoma macrostomum CBS 122681 TaxID=1314788 RepID=A0A6A6T247_9PLEO|nr:hypothetical protein K491DRAFT_501582 [Lophiostoma macrostomum CBS 122681]
MPEPTPISPPIQTDTSSSAAQPSGPISPVTRSGTFEHKTSGAVPPAIPEINTDIKAVNAAPVEIDGIQTSAEEVELKRSNTTGSRKGNLVSPNLGEEDEIEAEFLGEGEKGVGKELKEKRAAILAARSKDPGVIVNMPDVPTAEEVEAAKSADGTTTPAIPVEGK